MIIIFTGLIPLDTDMCAYYLIRQSDGDMIEHARGRVYEYTGKKLYVITKVFELIGNVINDTNAEVITLPISFVYFESVLCNVLTNLMMTRYPYTQERDLVDLYEFAKTREYLLTNPTVVFTDSECMKYALKRGREMHDSLLSCVLKYKSPDRINIIDIMCEHGYKLPQIGSEYAAYYGDIEFFKYVQSKGLYVDDVCVRAALFGKIELLKYAIENGGTWNDYKPNAIEKLIDSHMHPKIRYFFWKRITQGVCEAAVIGGYRDCLRYAHLNGCTYNKDRLLKLSTSPECGDYITIFM